MELKEVFTIFLHIDKYLSQIIQNFGVQTYGILFLVIFCETGLVIFPFLPGDSLLFITGTFAAIGSLDIYISFLILCLAAIIGDSLNYSIGKFLGKKAFESDSKFFKKEYLLKTEKFYEKYGNKTIVLARFVPIIRTFAPFIAGIGKMSYLKFLSYNIIGGILWIFIFLFGGYFFGNIPIVKDNFTIVILMIIIISIIPIILEIKNRNSNVKLTNQVNVLPHKPNNV